MQQRTSDFESREMALATRPARRIGAARATLVGVGIVIMATVFACAKDDSVTLGSGVADGPALAPIDAGTSAIDANVDAEVGLCVSTSCPAPWATCSKTDGTLPAFACGIDLGSDTHNCGACNNDCGEPAAAYHARMGCSSGQCQAFCREHYADCNGVPDDGCESDLQEGTSSCGACGVKCAPGVACRNGQCGCPVGQVDCDGQCVDVSSNNANCGQCGFACADHQPSDGGVVPDHMFFACSAGQCTALSCVQGPEEFWADCNGDKDRDGCEINLRGDVNNCGTCGNACDPGQQCFSAGGPVECQCKKGQTFCPGRSPFDACVDTENDPRNCGACGYVCPYVANTTPVCSSGRCRPQCLPGTADCNGRDDDGCEVDLNKDPRNCGACGAMCDVAQGQPCVGGRCLTGDCDGQVTR